MKIIRYEEAESKVFDGGPARGVVGRVVIGKADGALNFCMRVFEMASGGHTPLHSHDWEHEVFVHSGRGEVFQKGEWITITPGNAIFIPANEVHQMRNPGESPLVFVCLIPSRAPEL